MTAKTAFTPLFALKSTPGSLVRAGDFSECIAKPATTGADGIPACGEEEVALFSERLPVFGNVAPRLISNSLDNAPQRRTGKIITRYFPYLILIDVPSNKKICRYDGDDRPTAA